MTSAERTTGGWTINGMKNYATLAGHADFNIIAVGIKGMPPSEGHLNVVVPKGAPGFSLIEGSWNPLGMRAADSPSIRLENCFVPDEMVLGEPGTFPRERWQARLHLSFAAQYLGGSEGIFDILSEYLPKRGTTGDAYAQLRMGEIRIGIDSARWLIYRAAWLWTQGDRVAAELFSLQAKHRAIENAVITMDKAAQIAGSSAFWADAPMSRFYRDLRIHTLHENLDKTAATVGKFHLGEQFDTTARL
jgi:alkylation response protein AidB-like acyl-CoA dehydrogenase